MPDNDKVVIVTGANKGIGYAVVKNILKVHPDWTVYLTARDATRGEAAVKQLKKEDNFNARFHKLNINSGDSIRQFRNYLAKEHPQGIHALVNNAGIIGFMNPDEYTNNRRLRYEIFETNYFGTRNVCAELLPLIAENGRVVIVSSQVSHYTFVDSTEKTKQRIRSCSTVKQVDELINDFLAVDPFKLNENGWTVGHAGGILHSYGFSKIGLNLLAAIYSKSFADQSKNVIVNACCPGNVNTDANPVGMLTLDQGADTPVYLTLLPDDTDIRGQFVFQQKLIEMFPGNN